MNRHARGFTLIELSIALVIIALLAAAIVTGRTLIEQANIMRTKRVFTTTVSAYNAFRDKYRCLPGDCAVASNFLPGVSNGNGNGLIATYTTTSPVATHYESAFAIQHLMSAGLLTGEFIYTTGPFPFWNIGIFKGGHGGIYLTRWNNSYWPDAMTDPLIHAFMGDVSFDVNLPKFFDVKYDDGNGFTGRMRIIEDDPTSDSNCIDAAGQYRDMLYKPSGECGAFMDMRM